MSRGKNRKFAENAERGNVIQPGKPLYNQVKSKWKEIVFKNDNNLTIELGCGRGEYSVGLAEEFPFVNFVGIDIKGDRLWKGSGIAIEKKLNNVAFLRTQIQQLENFFAENEVDNIWITFPDPRPKTRDERRRLTFPRFLEIYKRILKKDGWVKFKTDNTDLFTYTLDTLNSGKLPVKNLIHTHDLYESDLNKEHFGIQTKYEKIFTEKGEKVKYLKFQYV